MSEMLGRATAAASNAWHESEACPGEMYVKEARVVAQAALIAALDPADEVLVETVARAMRQREVNAGEDGWAPMSRWDKQMFLGHAQSALIALQGAAQAPSEQEKFK